MRYVKQILPDSVQKNCTKEVQVKLCIIVLKLSRCLIMGNRILRLKFPELNRLKICLYAHILYQNFIPLYDLKLRLHFYAFMELSIYQTIMSSRYLPKFLKTIVDPFLERRCYFCHLKDILIAMFADDRDYVKVLKCLHYAE